MGDKVGTDVGADAVQMQCPEPLYIALYPFFALGKHEKLY